MASRSKYLNLILVEIHPEAAVLTDEIITGIRFMLLNLVATSAIEL